MGDVVGVADETGEVLLDDRRLADRRCDHRVRDALRHQVAGDVDRRDRARGIGGARPAGEHRRPATDRIDHHHLALLEPLEALAIGEGVENDQPLPIELRNQLEGALESAALGDQQENAVVGGALGYQFDQDLGADARGITLRQREDRQPVPHDGGAS